MQRLLQFYVIALIGICVFCYDPRLLDPFHHTRFMLGSFFLLITSLIIVSRKDRSKMNIGWLDLTIILFCVWNFISLRWSYSLSEALFAAQKWWLFAAGYFVSRFLIVNGGDSFRFYLSRYSRIATVVILIVVTVNIVLLSIDLGYTNESLYGLKVLFGHKSLISGFLVLLLPINLMVLERHVTIKWSLDHLLIAAQILVIILLQSRSAYVALFLCLLIIGIHFMRHRRELISLGMIKATAVFAGIILVVLSFFIITKPDFGERLNPLNYAKSQTATERQLIWIMTMDLVRDRPVLGVGAGNWKIELPGRGVEGSYRMQDQNVVFTRVHNDFLEVLSELGLIGLILFTAMFLIALAALWLNRGSKDAWLRWLLLAGILSYVILSLIDFPKERIEFLLILGVYLALASNYSKTSLPGNNFAKRWQMPLFLCLSLGLLTNIYVGYYRYKGEVLTKKIFEARSQEKWQLVIELAEKAGSYYYELDPSTVPVAFYSGVAHYNLGELQEAGLDFEIARSHHPFNFHVINNQATILIQQKEYEKAIPLLQEAVRINDRFEDALFNLAYCYYSLGSFDKALETVHKIPGESAKKEAFLKQISSAQGPD